ncbi:MAG: hypothetical protein HQK89_05735 [Nitrospirae bacterium]|nr:hypothetical protein [Nitrospirota bacterium]
MGIGFICYQKKAGNSFWRVLIAFIVLTLWSILYYPGTALSIAPDAYEPDDTYLTAKTITLNGAAPQLHNFHQKGDEDWVKFYGIKGVPYTIKVSNVGKRADVVIDLFESDGTTLITSKDDYLAGHDEKLYWPCPKEGFYYVRIRSYDPNQYGDDTGYSLEIDITAASFDCTAQGIVTDSITKLPVKDAVIKTDHLSNTGITDELGGYVITDSEGTHNIIVSHPGYETSIQSATFQLGTTTIAYFALKPQSAASSYTNIKANGNEGSINITSNDTLTITVRTTAGSLAGKSVDWWIYASTPFGSVYFDVMSGLMSWAVGAKVTYEGALFDLSPYDVLNISGLPEGVYTFYFDLDDKMDGIKDGNIYSDSVVVIVSKQ